MLAIKDDCLKRDNNIYDNETLHQQRTTGSRFKFFSTRFVNAWKPTAEDTIQVITHNELKSTLSREWRDHHYHFTNQANRNNNSTQITSENLNNANINPNLQTISSLDVG